MLYCTNIELSQRYAHCRSWKHPSKEAFAIQKQKQNTEMFNGYEFEFWRQISKLKILFFVISFVHMCHNFRLLINWYVGLQESSVKENVRNEIDWRTDPRWATWLRMSHIMSRNQDILHPHWSLIFSSLRQCSEGGNPLCTHWGQQRAPTTFTNNNLSSPSLASWINPTSTTENL